VGAFVEVWKIGIVWWGCRMMLRRIPRRSKVGVHNVIYIEVRFNYDCKRGIKKKESNMKGNMKILQERLGRGV
jgi:hypothetical protein